MRFKRYAGLALFLLLVASVTAQGELLFKEDFEGGLASRWKPVKFQGQTEHTILKEGTNSFLNASAASAASGLGVELANIQPEGASLSWRWKIDRTPPGGSEDVKRTFDHTARLFVAFKTLLGPPRTINYVWANQTAVGETFHHPSSGRGRFIVLQNGDTKAGQWILEERDIAADWKRLFGNDEPPPIVSIGLMTDSDGTRSTVVGCYDDIRLARKGRQDVTR